MSDDHTMPEASFPAKRRHSARRNPSWMRLNYKRMGRELAMQYLFQCDLTDGEQTAEMQERFWEQAVESGVFPQNRIFRKARNYASRVVTGIAEHEAEILDIIDGFSQKWDTERMSAVDRNIMKVAIYEMKFCPEIPPLVSIDEAIEIAKAFSSEKSGNFINGILNSVKSTLPQNRLQLRITECGEGEDTEEQE